MTLEITEANWIEQVGAPAYAAISGMVDALGVDWDRLEELRSEWADWRDLTVENSDPANGGTRRLSPDQVTRDIWEDCGGDAEELCELETAAGDAEGEDDARQAIEEDPLSIRVFGERCGGEWEAQAYEILLTTGGPAVRIVGELDQNDEPETARLEVQDWFKPWTEYPSDEDVLVQYALCFYFGT